ncbi:LysR family transcriptional regulator, partial [Escherichia coli]|uniref:LysR family transcriptional regulator n=1 Tax=Escherichia coli TaxID=562 RepID=UPI00215638B3
MKRPDYRTLQALDAVIRERGFERAAQKLCITQSAVSQRIKQLENMFGQPLLVRTVPPRPARRGIGKPLCDYLSTMAPRFIIYSSCNAQTMAKDIRE